MKKILAVVLCFLLIMALTACDKEAKNTDSASDDSSQTTNISSEALKENNTDGVNGNTSSGSVQPDNTNNNIGNNNSNNIGNGNINQSEQRKTEVSSKAAVTSNKNQSTNTTSKSTETDDSLDLGNIDNGVLENVTAKKMNLPQNLKYLGTNNIRVENNSKNIKTAVVIYQLDGDVVNWITQDNMIYVITMDNNQLAVINSETMVPVSNIPLAGKPAEIKLVGDEIYISLPDLCRIDIFLKSNLKKSASLYFEHEVSSFCVDGDNIYYSSDDQHCEVYKKNMTTNELTRILPDSGWSFYQPKLYLNKQDNILYIGETGITGSVLYYYDATTLQIKSMFKKNNYGIMNHTRDIFHVGDEIFWGNFRLSDTDAKKIIGRYGAVDYGSINFASEQLVSTFEGIFLADTYECIVNYWDSGFKYDYMLVSDSYNVFFRERGTDRNIIMGVNYSMQ